MDEEMFECWRARNQESAQIN
uniref:Uncharacterized protein n=1 Tax=Arundo donax TaxID=35708 RepID=A0A0A9EIX0_ARUDO